jgi:aldehyde dehydrogenase
VTKPEFARAATPKFKTRYDNFIGGRWVAPVNGRYFENTSPVNGRVLCEVARSDAADVELALDAAHAAKDAWGKTSVAERAVILNKIADRIEANLQAVAEAETWDNGKPVRETLAADIPLAIDHFRYFAGAIRAQEGGISEINGDTVAYHFQEPLGVVGQIIPWNFPLLMGVWKLAPALAAGNAVVIKPAEQTPASIMVFIELIADLLPAGVVNVVNGFGLEAGKPLAQSPRIRKIAFTGETTTGRLIMQYASENIIPVIPARSSIGSVNSSSRRSSAVKRRVSTRTRASAMPAATWSSCALVTTEPTCQSKPARRAWARPAGSRRVIRPVSSTTSRRPPVCWNALASSAAWPTAGNT